MKILALDQSTKITGWAIIETDEYCGVVFESGLINKSKIKDVDIRFGEMCKDIFNLINSMKDLDAIYIEETALQSNPKTLRLLAQLQGAIISICVNKGITYKVIEPSKWRSKLLFKQGRGIKRDELKRQAIDYVKDKFDMDCNEDEAEAICIGLSQV